MWISGNLDRHESNGPCCQHVERKEGRERERGEKGRFVAAIARPSQDEVDLQESENMRRQVRNQIPLRHSSLLVPGESAIFGIKRRHRSF